MYHAVTNLSNHSGGHAHEDETSAFIVPVFLYHSCVHAYFHCIITCMHACANLRRACMHTVRIYTYLRLPSRFGLFVTCLYIVTNVRTYVGKSLHWGCCRHPFILSYYIGFLDPLLLANASATCILKYHAKARQILDFMRGVS